MKKQLKPMWVLNTLIEQIEGVNCIEDGDGRVYYEADEIHQIIEDLQESITPTQPGKEERV